MTVKESEKISKDSFPSVHITRDLFCDWQEGKLKGKEETDFLGHIGTCTFCAEQFGNWMEEGMLMESPGYLKEEVLSRTRQMDVQAAVKLKETSRQMQLFMYSLKVGLAVAFSIFLLTVTADIQNINLELPENQQVEQMQEKRREAREQKESRGQEGSITDRLRKGSSWVTGILNDVSSGIFRVEIENSENEKNQEVTR